MVGGPEGARGRRAITVTGIVQGVGFRPHVHAIASREMLAGFVANRVGEVCIEIEGDDHAIDRFVDALVREAPPLARIDQVACAAVAPKGDRTFRIAPSDLDSTGPIALSPDVATCDACVVELFDPSARRYRYPFVNCAHCGPRFTIVTGSPYDRARTTMHRFAMCEACRAEYDDPSDRRFHAQPIACPACGPSLRALDANTLSTLPGDPLVQAMRALVEGKIVAIKGVGGYHLACDAEDANACRDLRRRKARDAKPFAVMVADALAAERIAHVSPDERGVLASAERPIVLLRRRATTRIADAAAPSGGELVGVMLAYSPLHHLLARGLGRPLVMTSGNVSDEPIAYDDADMRARLAPLADLVLIHDRRIHARCDDSVVRVVAGAPRQMRRARGFAPAPLALPFELDCPTLALGGHLKATFALGDRRRAIVSHHLGDLEHAEAYRAYLEAIARFEQVFRISPTRVVHDAHPDYASTRYAIALEQERGIARIAVQHHRAHVASVITEAAIEGRVLGVAFDGAGWGDDGQIWGGEIFAGDCHRLDRVAHLACVPMPGGERAAREPWRMALSWLRSAGEDISQVASRVDASASRIVLSMIERNIQCPGTSSVGRLFDAIAALTGVCDRMTYEGQAAMMLEARASVAPLDGAYPHAIVERLEGPLVLDARPLVRAAAEDVRRGADASTIARRFHAGLASIVVSACERLRARTSIDIVVLAGGVFMNAILVNDCVKGLSERGFRVHIPRVLPSNDGGICLGQLAIAHGQGGS